MLGATRRGLLSFSFLMVCVGATAARTRAQPVSPATVRGTVVDAANGEPIIGAHVRVVDRDTSAQTDVDGRFDLVLPPGTYEITVSSPLYETKRVTNVTADAAQPARLAISLRAKVDTSVEIVEVVADVTAATEATQLLKRRMAPTVSDNLGAESIAKTPDSDAAEVVTRVPAVTIKDDKFVVVRGLNERYSSAVLNRSRLPSTDPNRRVVPLDLFPADFIESISIIKSYTPDLPGDFAGGLVDIRLTDPPPRLSYSIGFSTGVNTATTFQGFDTYDGTTADWFGFGEDFRGLPDGFPGFGEDFDQAIAGSSARMRDLVAALPQNWNIHEKTAPPNFGVDASVGDTLGPFGFNLAGNYGTKHQARRDEILSSFGIGSTGNTEFTYDRSTFETDLGAILSTSYKPSNLHKLNGRALFNRKSKDEVLDGQGSDESDQSKIKFPTSQEYIADQLVFGQLEGQHHFSLLDVDWRGSWASSREDQPDTKIVEYFTEPPEDLVPELEFKNPSLSRQFALLDEFLQDYDVDFTIPFDTGLPFTDVWSGMVGQLKTGVAYSLRDRTFDYRFFTTESGANVNRLDKTQSPDQVLDPRNYGTKTDGGPLVFEDVTNDTDQFRASQEIAAAYGMIELPIVRDRLRLIGGARVEYSYIDVDFGDGGQTIINDLDPLPAATLIYSPRDDMNVRVAYSQTVSRPEFRELNRVQFQVEPGERPFQGNPNLESSHITSYDLRWEWFFSRLELVSASFFYKELDKPIEITNLPSASLILDFPVNAKSATAWGIELEGRKNFNFLVPPLRRWRPIRGVASYVGDLELITNVSFVQSEAKDITDPSRNLANTNPNRQLQGQAPFVVNATLEYEHYRWGTFRLLYNTVGETINAAGLAFPRDDGDGGSEEELVGLEDIFQQRRDQLDFVWLFEIKPFGTPLGAKFAIENILNDDYVETQEDPVADKVNVTKRYFTGVTFSFGLTYRF